MTMMLTKEIVDMLAKREPVDSSQISRHLGERVGQLEIDLDMERT
jgi:hypothetical protein